MDIRIDELPPLVRVALSGRLDRATAPRLRQQLEPLLAQRAEPLLLDLDGLALLAAAGARLLLDTHRQLLAQDRRLALCAPRPAVQATLALAALPHLLPVYADAEAARLALAA
jgi:anti-anti-sigma factor